MRLTEAFLLAKEFVGAVLDPARRVGVGRAAVGRVVLEAAVVGRVVGRRDDDAVGQPRLASAVVGEDRARHDGRRRRAVVGLDDDVHAVPRQHLERRVLRRRRERVRVLAHEERAAGALGLPVVADRLVMATMCPSLKEPRSDEPRCPLVPKLTSCVRSPTSGQCSK
jgi:hypothetical protein